MKALGSPQELAREYTQDEILARVEISRSPLRLLDSLFGVATEAEQRFLIRLLAGELRHGALEGVLTEAVAEASGVSGERTRRGVMLSGSLPATAMAALRGGVEAVAAFRLEVGRGVRPMPTPAGVPVLMMSPGSSVMSRVM